MVISALMPFQIMGRPARQVQEYAQETSIHGVKYVFQRERTQPERFCWLLLCLGMVVLGAILVSPIVDNYVNEPTITSIASTQ